MEFDTDGKCDSTNGSGEGSTEGIESARGSGQRQTKEAVTGDDGGAREPTGGLVDRRSVLKAVGGAAALVGSSIVGSVNAAPVIDLGRKGLRPGDRVDPYLDSYFNDGSEVHVPPGTYRWEGTSLDATADAALVGDGDVEFDIPEISLMENVTAKEGTVTIKNVTQTGAVDSTGTSRIAAWAESGAKLVFENFNRPDGQFGDGSGGPIGYFTPPHHAGTMVYRNCHVEGFGNNGIYASAAAKKGDGPVVVEGGLYRNNNIAGVRVGSTGSVVRNATIVNDDEFTDVVGPGGGRNARLLWVRMGGDDVTIDDVDLTATRGAHGTSLGIGVIPRNDAGSGTVRNVRLRNDRSMPSIKVKDSVAGDWSGNGVHLTGNGDVSTVVNADGWVACAGSGCTDPTTEERRVGQRTA